MDGEEAVVESGGCDSSELPNEEPLLQADPSATDSNQEERKDPPVDEGDVAGVSGVANDETSAQVGSEGSPNQGECDRPPSQPEEDPGGDRASEEASLGEASQSLDFLQKQQEVVLKGQQLHEQQLSGELSGEQSPDEHDGKGREETVEKSEEERERVVETGGQEESGSLQSLQPASQGQTFSTDESLDPSEKGSSLSQEELNPPNGNLNLNNESADCGQSSLQKHGHLEQESSYTAGEEPIINQLPGENEDQYKNNTMELKNADISENLQHGNLSSNNEDNILATDPGSSQEKDSMTNIQTPGNQLLHNDYFTPPNPGSFPAKPQQHPNPLSSHMKTAHTDNKDTHLNSAFLWMNHYRPVLSQGHSLAAGLSYVHENQTENWPQQILMDNGLQKEFMKNGSSTAAPGAVPSESSSEQREFFSGSAMSHPKSFDPGHPDSVLISASHNVSARKSAVLDGRLLPNNATPGLPNTKVPRMAVSNFSDVLVGEPQSNVAGKLRTDVPNPAVIAHKTKAGFPDPLDKGYSSLPTPWLYGGVRSMPTSPSVPFLTPSMSLPSPIPTISSSLGEDSPSSGNVTKQDPAPYPTDAHSAPPMDICSNSAQSMRPPSAPISTRPGTKSPFFCDECTRLGGASEKCSNKKCRFYFSKPSGNIDNARSNIDRPTPPLMAGRQKINQSAFTSQNSNHQLHRGSCSQNITTCTTSASSPIVSPSYHPLPSIIKREPSPPNSISTNATMTNSGVSPFCFTPPNTNFMHSKDSPYSHKMPPFYQASSVSNAPKMSSQIYTNHIPSSYSNNNVTVDKPARSFGIPVNTKAGRTASNVPEDLTKLQHHGHPSMSSSSERKLTHVCLAPNLVAPLYTSSIYTCSSNTSTFSSSTQSNQSQLNMESAYNRYSNPSTFPAPPSYSEVIQQKNNSLKNHDLLMSQQLGNSCKKLLWQPFSDEKPMVRVKTEVVTGTYPGEVPIPPQQHLPSSSSAPATYGQLAFQDPQLGTSDKEQFSRQPLPSPAHFLPQAIPQTSNKRPLDMCRHSATNMKADIKSKLGENGTSIPPNLKRQKVLHRNTPSSHNESKQFKSWSPKIEVNPSNVKNEIKCTFKIKNSEFNETHFQNAFLNSCPKNTNIPLDKMNQITNALSETTKRIFNNNKHPPAPTGNESRPTPAEADNGRKTPDRKPVIKTEPGLDPFENGFKVEPEADSEDLFKRLKANRKMEIPTCGCLGPGYVPSEAVEGPYYTHLGSGSCLEEIKKMMEERSGLTGKAIRVEKIIYSGKEGKSTQGCPIAKWIIRRAGVEEKLLCLVRQRRGHFCPTAYLVICIVAWEGVPKSVADDMYSYLVPTLTEFGFETDRRCGYNEQKTCACQGVDMKKRGASFSFGCSWSMYFNGCKFARSREAKKFRLKDTTMDEVVEGKFQNLATRLAPLYKCVAPESYQNQVFFEDKGYECRLGRRTENDEKPCRPFSGVTACVDFCAHAHKDLHNMNNGCTVVVTLTKHGPLERPDEEQLHVLPLYILDVDTNSLEEKLKNGSVEILPNYPKVARIRATPVTPKRKGKNAKKDSPSNKKANALASKLLNAKNSSYIQSQAAKNISGLNHKTMNKTNLFKCTGEKNPQLVSSKGEGTITSSGQDLKSKPSETNIQPPLPANANMYDEFWKYFYSYGTFPPANFLKDASSADSMKLFASRLSDSKPAFAPSDKSATLLQHPAGDSRPGSACGIPLGNPGMKDIKCPYSVSSLTSDDFESPLHLLSEAVMIRSQTSIEKPRPAASHPQAGANVSHPRKPAPNVELSSAMGVAGNGGGGILGAGGNLPPHLANKAFANANAPSELAKDPHSINSNFDRENIFDKNKLCNNGMPPHTLQTSTQTPLQTPLRTEMDPHPQADCPDELKRESAADVIRAELEYNEQNFCDPDIGGVAIALTHGSVLFEVAKRELHATTALLNPNRYSPTRISLVFYQHKSMNLRYHGWYENERKHELQRQKRLQKMQEEAEKGPPIITQDIKPGRKKRKKEEPPVASCAAEIKTMWQASIRHTITQTTDTIITQWIDPQPTVTGPYQKWI